MTFLEEANKIGFNVDDALERFMGNSQLLEKMIKMFPASVYPSRFGGSKEEDLEVLKFINSGDYQTAVAKAHTLKSMTGNLSLTLLYQAYTKIVDYLRAGNPDKAKELTVKIVPIQEKIFQQIQQLP